VVSHAPRSSLADLDAALDAAVAAKAKAAATPAYERAALLRRGNQAACTYCQSNTDNRRESHGWIITNPESPTRASRSAA